MLKKMKALELAMPTWVINLNLLAFKSPRANKFNQIFHQWPRSTYVESLSLYNQLISDP